MLFYLGPIATFIIVFSLCASIFERGKFPEAAGSALFFSGASCMLFMLLIPFMATSTEQVTVWTKPVDGKVLTSDDKDSYIFRSNGKNIVLDANNADLFTGAEINSYERVCEKTPDFIAPWDYGDCDYRIFIKG